MAHGITLPQAMCNRCSYKFILLDPNRATADRCDMQNEAKKSLFFKGHCLDQPASSSRRNDQPQLAVERKRRPTNTWTFGAILRIYLRTSQERRVPRLALETNRNKVAARLVREGWEVRHGGDHDVYKHPTRVGRIVLPRHRTLSPGVARAVARQAGWLE